jgi:hypothetical protein
MNQDKSLVSPEIENVFTRRRQKFELTGWQISGALELLAPEYGSMPYPENRKIVKMFVVPRGNKRQVLQDFLQQGLLMCRYRF